MATRIQDRLQKPKGIPDVPWVECPEDPDQRRESLRADLPNLVRYDSNELKEMGEEAKAPTAEEAPQDQKKVEPGGPAPQPVPDDQVMIHNRHRYATSPTRRSSNAAPATPSRSQAGPSHASSLRLARSHSIFDDGETSDLSPRISLKRKRGQSQRFSSRKLCNTTLHTTQTATSLPTPASSARNAQNVAEQNLVPSTPPIHSPGLHLVGGEDGGNMGGTLPRPTTTPPPIDLEPTDDVGHLLSLFRKQSSRAAQPSAHPHQEREASPHQERDVPSRQEREVPSHGEVKLRHRVCKCDRSLDGVIGMMKDCKTGTKQWKSSCCHGCPLAHGPRHVPCLCHNCQLLSLEQIAGAGTPETTPPSQPLHSTRNLRPAQAPEQNPRRVTVQSLLTDL
ncbi:hypothetical protein EJ07DRAFT_158810 [Lizonia empirigonia]|nr:hypothetical protein EJ07DRAFT_158810 [Lizonia empirigonia]